METQIDAAAHQDNVGQIAEAMTAKGRELGILPLECKYECSISIGPDGKPVYSCKIVC